MRLICGNFAGNNQKGFGLAALLVVVLVILGLFAGGFWWLMHSKIDPLKVEVIDSAQSSSTPSLIVNEYISPQKWGFRFEYPQSITIESEDNGDDGYLVTIKDGTIKKSSVLVVGGDQVFRSPGITPDKFETYDGVSWSFYESTEVCDAGECGETDPSYEVVKNGLRYMVVATNQDQDMKVTKQILESWKFR